MKIGTPIYPSVKSDIFDTKSTTDLPPVIQKRLSASYLNKGEKVMSLFDIKTPLTFHEIQAACYRKYGLIFEQNYMLTTMLRKLRKLGKIDYNEGEWFKV